MGGGGVYEKFTGICTLPVFEALCAILAPGDKLSALPVSIQTWVKRL